VDIKVSGQTLNRRIDEFSAELVALMFMVQR
jgi:hypothetical protein